MDAHVWPIIKDFIRTAKITAHDALCAIIYLSKVGSPANVEAMSLWNAYFIREMVIVALILAAKVKNFVNGCFLFQITD